MRDHTGNFRGFSILSQAYYSSAVKEPNSAENITVGLYHPDGGTSGEFNINWVTGLLSKNPAAKLEAFDDSWSALSKFPDLLAYMAEIDGQDVTPQQFADKMKDFGIVDITARTRRNG